MLQRTWQSLGNIPLRKSEKGQNWENGERSWRKGIPLEVAATHWHQSCVLKRIWPGSRISQLNRRRWKVLHQWKLQKFLIPMGDAHVKFCRKPESSVKRTVPNSWTNEHYQVAVCIIVAEEEQRLGSFWNKKGIIFSVMLNRNGWMLSVPCVWTGVWWFLKRSHHNIIIFQTLFHTPCWVQLSYVFSACCHFCRRVGYLRTSEIWQYCFVVLCLSGYDNGFPYSCSHSEVEE